MDRLGKLGGLGSMGGLVQIDNLTRGHIGQSANFETLYYSDSRQQSLVS